ncbi:MAG: succinate dehydrogenase, hydrophobic membrane anchor protein [Gammaproteobacteria bacterium]
MSMESSGLKAPRLKSPLGQAIGHGSAHAGTEHFLAQRLTAIALVPLTLWLAFSLLMLPALDFYTVTAWAAAPLHAVGLALLVIALTYHSSLGLQVVIEDYVHANGPRIVLQVLLRLVHAALAVAGILAVIQIATRASL